MKLKKLAGLASALMGSMALASCTTVTPAEPLALAGAPCSEPPVLRCPDGEDCGALVVEQGPVKDAESGRNYFADYPCDLKKGEDVTLVLNLHGGGSYGNWQRHYFPIVDYVEEKRLVVLTPNAPPRVWLPDNDDAYLQRIVQSAIDQIGPSNVRSFWLSGHSQGGMTSRRVICSDYFADKVDGFLSLSGGRVGGNPAWSAQFRPAPQRGQEDAPGFASEPRTRRALAAPVPDLTCDFSHIFAIGQHEINELPDTSDWATKFGCDARTREEDMVDTKAGYIYDSSRQDPPTLGWGRPAKPGTAQAWEYKNCNDGRVVADVMRMDKGHTEGLEPVVTEYIVDLMLSAKGGKIAGNAS